MGSFGKIAVWAARHDRVADVGRRAVRFELTLKRSIDGRVNVSVDLVEQDGDQLFIHVLILVGNIQNMEFLRVKLLPEF